MNRPKVNHYTIGNIECIDFILDKKLDHCRGSAIKYIVRAGHKDDEIGDLQKAIDMLEFEIEDLKERKEEDRPQAESIKTESKNYRS